jgi:thiosulfate dehydrogenase [quinone] large subunit
MAFFGVVLNLSFMFSGSAGVNPAFAIVGLLLVLAWRNAGWYGLDRWVLPLRGRWGCWAATDTSPSSSPPG